MSDFNGLPLILRDKIERQFWGSVYAAEPVSSPRGDVADAAVIEMRIRQRATMKADGIGARLCCAVCLNPSIEDGKPAPHAEGCPLTGTYPDWIQGAS